VATELAVVPGTAIGRESDSGAALGPSLGLYVFDMETESYLNPLSVLPALQDKQPPVISRVLIRREGGMTELVPGATTPPGAVDVLVETYDLREDLSFRWRLAPYEAILAVNGKQTAFVTFESLRAGSANALEVGGRPAASVYAGPWLLALGRIQLQLGETHLQVFVRDLAGNESTRELFLSIKG
jgi:hypothetical protein